MSCCLNRQDFCVAAGETFLPTIRWALTTLSSAAITNMTQAAPLSVTAPTHAVPDGWPVAIVSARGMTQANANHYPPTAGEWHFAQVQGQNLLLNDVNSADFTAYTSGGFVVYRTPVDLTGAMARMRIYDAPEGGTLLMTLTEISGITLNNTIRTVTPRIDTATVAWTTGYYDLEMTDAGGVVAQILAGVITIQS